MGGTETKGGEFLFNRWLCGISGGKKQFQNYFHGATGGESPLLMWRIPPLGQVPQPSSEIPARRACQEADRDMLLPPNIDDCIGTVM
jgi:hypothetical protein